MRTVSYRRRASEPFPLRPSSRWGAAARGVHRARVPYRSSNDSLRTMSATHSRVASDSRRRLHEVRGRRRTPSTGDGANGHARGSSHPRSRSRQHRAARHARALLRIACSRPRPSIGRHATGSRRHERGCRAPGDQSRFVTRTSASPQRSNPGSHTREWLLSARGSGSKGRADAGSADPPPGPSATAGLRPPAVWRPHGSD